MYWSLLTMLDSPGSYKGIREPKLEKVYLETNEGKESPGNTESLSSPNFGHVFHGSLIKVRPEVAKVITNTIENWKQGEDGGHDGINLHVSDVVLSNGFQSRKRPDNGRSPNPLPKFGFWYEEFLQFKDEDVQSIEDVFR